MLNGIITSEQWYRKDLERSGHGLMWGTILTRLKLRTRKMKPFVRIPRLLVEMWIWDLTSWELPIEWHSWFNHLNSSRDEYGLWSSSLLNFIQLFVTSAVWNPKILVKVLFSLETTDKFSCVQNRASNKSETDRRQKLFRLVSSVVRRILYTYQHVSGTSCLQLQGRRIKSFLPWRRGTAVAQWLTLIVLMWRIGWAHNNARK